MNKPVIDTVQKRWTGHTPEAKQRIREAKLGEKNPNAKGLSLEHKRKIAQAMKVRRGEFHHFYNQRHSARSRMKTSWSLRKLPKRRWCVDMNGKEHLVWLNTQLPPGWAWGRNRYIRSF
jgi:hypothetical protein